MLEINDLGYSIAHKKLLNGFNARFQTGKIYAVIGPNGSGKTTLLKCMTGIKKPTAGFVYWNNENLLTQPRRTISKIITYIPTNPPISFDFTVQQFVSMGLYPHGSHLNPQRIQAALQAVDAVKYSHRSMNDLSQGERQRIYIARALATEAYVLAFDEPTANLDIKYQNILWNLLKELSKQKIIILTTHDVSKCELFCDRVYVLNSGTCVALGTFSETMSREVWHHVFGVDPPLIPSSQNLHNPN